MLMLVKTSVVYGVATISITTFSVMTLSVKGLNAVLSLRDVQHK
jgi:hypothetical protein